MTLSIVWSLLLNTSIRQALHPFRCSFVYFKDGTRKLHGQLYLFTKLLYRTFYLLPCRNKTFPIYACMFVPVFVLFWTQLSFRIGLLVTTSNFNPISFSFETHCIIPHIICRILYTAYINQIWQERTFTAKINAYLECLKHPCWVCIPKYASALWLNS